MKWTENTIRNIIADLAEDNHFACRALFSITTVTFTRKVPTLAVSLSKTPTLFINREFLEEHAQTEDDIKAVLMHEFLHVVLLHTEKYTLNNPLMNIALDAVINSIIHRTYGEAYSNFFRKFYFDLSSCSNLINNIKSLVRKLTISNKTICKFNTQPQYFISIQNLMVFFISEF